MERLIVTLSGSFLVTLHGEPAVFATDRARALFAFLIAEADIPHRRDSLAALIWPEYPNSDARKNLSQTLLRVRRAIGDAEADPPYLEINAKTIQFNADLAELDIRRFQELIGDCPDHAHAEMWHCPECIPRLEDAANLYRGDFLQGLFLPDSQPFEEWVLGRRERLHQQALDVFHQLARCHENQGDTVRARAYAQRQLALEPWQENAHRQIMRSLALEGNRSGALAQYELCEQILENELRVKPEPKTTALYERIKSGALKGGMAISTPSHNLPASLTPLRGRISEIGRLLEVLKSPAHRLVTIVGEGGVGKSRLALATAEQLIPRFSHGAWFISLASLNVGTSVQLMIDQLVTAIAAELRLELTNQSDLKRQLFTQLHGKALLLILDNFEHLISCGPFLSEMLQALPGIKILVTSRFALNLSSESLFPLEGMPVPDTADALSSAETGSVKLFMDVAGRLNAPVLLSRDLGEIVRICQIVDGLPLGIEIAASWSNHFTCQEIADLLREQFDSLTALSSDLPARQRSLRAVFEYSWDLLSRREQQILAQCSIFRGGFSRACATQVTGATVKDLAGLAGRCLIKAVSPGRYDMHERVKRFASEKLQGQVEKIPGQGENLHEAFSRFFLEMLIDKGADLHGMDVSQVFREMYMDLDNFRQAWGWAVIEGKWDMVCRASHGLSYFYYLAGSSGEAEKVLRQAIERLDNVGWVAHEQEAKFPLTLGTLLVEQAFHLNRMAMYERALEVLQRAISLAESSRDALILSRGLVEQTQAQKSLGFRDEARNTAEKAVDIAKANGLAQQEADGARWIAFILMEGEDHPAILPFLEQSLAIYKNLGDQLGIVRTLELYAGYSEWTGHLSRAKSYREQSLRLTLEMENRIRASKTYINLGGVYGLLGNYQAAKNHYKKAKEIASEIGVPLVIAHANGGLAYIHRSLEDLDRAKKFNQQAIAQAKNIGERELHLAGLLEAGILSCMQFAFTEARRVVDQAYSLARELKFPIREYQCKVISGWISSSLGKHLEAIQEIDPVVDYMEGHTLVSYADVFMYYDLCYQILAAAADERAGHVLCHGYRLLQEWGGRIEDESARRSFLENVPAHRRIAAVWKGREIPIQKVNPA